MKSRWATRLGRATPESISAMLDAVLGEGEAAKFAGHYHDTSGRACDNVEASLGQGHSRV